MFLKSASKQSKGGSVYDVNNMNHWIPKSQKSESAKSRKNGMNGIKWNPHLAGKSERIMGFTDKVNLQEVEKKLSDHRRNITERQFIFSDSDSEDHQFMTTPRKARPAKGF